MSRKDRNFYILISLLVLTFNIVPFVLASQAGGKEYIFNGTFLNPFDGQSYLAKMYQGYQGNWRFTLPYTADPGQGAYLFLFYIFLGHLARIFGLSLLMTFMISRLLGGVVLLITLVWFFTCIIPDSRPRRVAFSLATLGSGMGWIVIPLGEFTSDFWVAETYPFLSIYSNAHFSVGLALVLFLLTFPFIVKKNPSYSPFWMGLLISGLSFLVALINPFGVVIAVVVMSSWLIVEGFSSLILRNWREFFSHPQFFYLLWIIVGGVPFLVYQYLAILTDPVLAGWNAQNITVTPPWWDLLISLSPAIVLAFVGIRQMKTDSPSLLSAVWVIVGLILIFIPFGLQRRFMMGLYVPLAGLAALGIETLSKGKRSRIRLFVVSLFLMALPTNLIVILAGQSGTQAHDLALYHTQDESSGFMWLATNTAEDALVLAAPDTGLLIPAFSGRQVIYGHPFETTHAEQEKQLVVDFFESMTDEEALSLLTQREVDFVFFGSRERNLGLLPIEQILTLVFEQGEVQIYRVER